MKRIVFTLVATLMFSFAVSADIARPETKPKPVKKPAKQVEANMVIRLDATATEATLRIPKTHLPKLKADLDLLENESGDDTAAVTTNMQRLQTIVGGTFLSLAFVFGGFWFVKRNGKGAAAAGVIALVVGSGAAVSLVYANVGPPPSARKITSKIFDANIIRPYGYISGKVKMEIGDTDTIELIVPEENVQRPNPNAKSND